MSVEAGTVRSPMVCAGCGAVLAGVPGPGRASLFACPRAGLHDEVEHVLMRTVDPSLRFPVDHEPNPFVRYRHLFFSYDVARAHGMRDEEYGSIVQVLDSAIAHLEGSGFLATPFARHAALSDGLGQRAVWIKDETANVSGSHKARHLMGIMIYLQVLDALGNAGADARTRQGLAIASCGNAALAAAVVARAAGRALDVFIPPDAPPAIVARLAALGASTIVCPRQPGGHGDPCYLRFQDAVSRGAVPFCCQGPANALTIEGGKTLGYEMIAALGGAALDCMVIQVGGGALASSVIQAFADGMALAACPKLPRVYAVQTQGAFPLKRAYDRIAARIAHAPGPDAIERELHYAATHRREFMWPWEQEPRSVARGILDDETYDWLAIVKGMLQTGGAPVVVSEAALEDAYALARTATGAHVDHTGAAGLAGLLQLRRDGAIDAGETVGIIFSGVQRD